MRQFLVCGPFVVRIPPPSQRAKLRALFADVMRINLTAAHHGDMVSTAIDRFAEGEAPVEEMIGQLQALGAHYEESRTAIEAYVRASAAALGLED